MNLLKKVHQKIILLVSIIFVLVLPVNAQSDRRQGEKSLFYPVARIVDGDTFWIDDGSEKGMKVRLTGVDAPETRNSRNKVKTAFGNESTRYLTDLIAGKMVRLEYDIDTLDQYGRTLAYVYLEDGTFVNASMVRNGYATVMTTPPNVRYADTFVELAQKARKRNRGLWNQEVNQPGNQQGAPD
ncbi:MAG: thermonuclease family protein [Bacteroidales bacterium]|jgi:micrococcal nuclease|nr:thermonuclease family protein [Bacteroidales bacterium]